MAVPPAPYIYPRYATMILSRPKRVNELERRTSVLVLRLRHKIHRPLEVFSANVRGSGRLR